MVWVAVQKGYTPINTDVIVLSTGFEVNESVRVLNLVGRDGCTLDDVWDDVTDNATDDVPHLTAYRLGAGASFRVDSASILTSRWSQVRTTANAAGSVAPGSGMRTCRGSVGNCCRERSTPARNPPPSITAPRRSLPTISLGVSGELYARLPAPARVNSCRRRCCVKASTPSASARQGRRCFGSTAAWASRSPGCADLPAGRGKRAVDQQ